MKQKNDTLSRLKAQERQVRQELIIDAARRVFGERTYDKVSMAEIARAAGIAKSSIYTYFENQEALFVEVAFRDTRTFIDDLEKRIETAGPRPLEAAIDHFLEYYIAHEAHWRMITRFALYGDIGPESAEKLNLASRGLIRVLAGVLEKEGDTGDPPLMAHTLFASLCGALIAFRKYPGRTEAERIAHIRRIAANIERMFRTWMKSETGKET